MNAVLQGWHSPKQYELLINRLMQDVPSETLFRQPELKPLREAWVLSEFARLHGEIESVRLLEDDPPDGEAKLGSDGLIRLEIVEVLEPGRRRGDEYRSGQSLRHEPVELWQARADVLIEATQNVVQKKIKKSSGPGWSLLVYLNLGPTFGVGRDENKAALPVALKDAVRRFGRVWILWDGELLQFPTP